MTALYNGVSGIKTNSIGIDVTGNNIANANTVGFKNSQAEFKDLFYQRAAAMSQNPVTSSLGLGTTMAATALDTMHLIMLSGAMATLQFKKARALTTQELGSFC